MASIRVLLYVQKVLKNGEHPIVLQIIKDRKVKKITLGSCLPSLWDSKLQLPKHKHPQFRDLEILIEKKKSEAKKLLIILEHEKENFSLADFENELKTKNESKSKSVFGFIDTLITNLINENRIGNADVYKDLKRFLSRFRNGKDLGFAEIDDVFLSKLEQDCRNRGMSEVSMSTYFRTLRALYNKAIKEKYVKEINYPFSDFKISKFNTQTEKRAINWTDMQKIIDLDIPKESDLYDTQQIFIFSYFAWGINFTDIATLEWSDLKSNVLKYTRSKNGRSYTIPLIVEAMNILDNYRQYRSDDYIFPILYKKRHKTATSSHNRIKKINREVNDNLKKIGSLIGIDGDITFYVARHTFATVLKKKGLPTPVIQEMMGHDSEKTTQIYLDGFDNQVLYDASKLLVN